VNQPKCTLITSTSDDSSLFFASQVTTCDTNNTLETWQIAVIIVVASVIFLGIVFITIVLLVPKLKNVIFPSHKIRENIKHKEGGND